MSSQGGSRFVAAKEGKRWGALRNREELFQKERGSRDPQLWSGGGKKRDLGEFFLDPYVKRDKMYPTKPLP